MIGPDKNKWDEVGIVWYPNMKKFLEMTEIDWYKSSFVHREAALNDTRLITCYDTVSYTHLTLPTIYSV